MFAVLSLLALAVALATVYVLTTGSSSSAANQGCCCELSSSSSSSQSKSSSSQSSQSASSVSASSQSASQQSQNQCCHALGPQLGLFLTCAPEQSTSGNGGNWNPNPPQPPQSVPCENCDVTPAQWDVNVPTPGGFTGIFFPFNGQWTLIQLSETPCIWLSDPASPILVRLTIDSGCGVTLLFADSVTKAFAEYEGSLNKGKECNCCQSVTLTLSAFGVLPGGNPNWQGTCPQSVTAVPDCGGTIQTNASSSQSASQSSCACQPCEVCLNVNPDGSYSGFGCNLDWHLACVGVGPDGYQLTVTVDGVTSVYTAASTSTCTPLQLLFFNIVGPCGQWHAVVSSDTSPCGSSSSSQSASSASASSQSASSVSQPSISQSSVSRPSASSQSVPSQSGPPAPSQSSVSSSSQQSQSGVIEQLPWWCVRASPGNDPQDCPTFGVSCFNQADLAIHDIVDFPDFAVGTPVLFNAGQCFGTIVGGPYTTQLECNSLCVEGSVASSGSSGSSSSGSKGGVSVQCCQGGALVPQTMHVTITGGQPGVGTPPCDACTNGTYAVQYNAGVGAWISPAILGCTVGQVVITLACSPNICPTAGQPASYTWSLTLQWATGGPTACGYVDCNTFMGQFIFECPGFNVVATVMP